MKRFRSMGLVGCSLLLGAVFSGCAKQTSVAPLPPGEVNAMDSNSAPHPSGKRAPCTLGQDQTCNADPKVSALWGKCLETGVCECKPGFELNPMGSCAPAR